MKNWKFIKTGNELPNDAEIKYKGYIIRYYPYQGKYLVEHKTDFSKTNPFIGKKFSTSEEAIKEIEKLSVGNRNTRNESILTKDGLVNYPDKEIGEINILKRELEGLMRMAEKDKSTDYSKQIEALKKEISEKKNKYALGNKKTGNSEFKDVIWTVEDEDGSGSDFQSESIAYATARKWAREKGEPFNIFKTELDENGRPKGQPKFVKTVNSSIQSQEWSMFKGLSKDAEKEVGNDSIGDEYNAEIYRLEKKKMDLERMGQGQKAMEIEKQIQQLQKELREYDIGNKKTGNGALDYQIVRPKSQPAKYKVGEEVKTNKGKGKILKVQPMMLSPTPTYLIELDNGSKEWRYEEEIGNKKTGNRKIGSDDYEVVGSESGKYYVSKNGGSQILGPFASTDDANKKIDEIEKTGAQTNNLKRARNSIKTKNSDVTLWNGNDTAYIKEDGHVQFLENNAFLVEEDKYDSQEQAVEDLTKKGYRKK